MSILDDTLNLTMQLDDIPDRVIRINESVDEILSYIKEEDKLKDLDKIFQELSDNTFNLNTQVSNVLGSISVINKSINKLEKTYIDKENNLSKSYIKNIKKMNNLEEKIDNYLYGTILSSVFAIGTVCCYLLVKK